MSIRVVSFTINGRPHTLDGQPVVVLAERVIAPAAVVPFGHCGLCLKPGHHSSSCKEGAR